jgi:hypothetical protein
MRGNEPFGHLLERHSLSGSDHGRGLLLPPVLARIDPFGDQAAVVCVQLGGALERNILGRAYATPLILTCNRVTAGPGLRGCATDFEIEPVFVGVLARTECLRLSRACLIHL